MVLIVKKLNYAVHGANGDNVKVYGRFLILMDVSNRRFTHSFKIHSFCLFFFLNYKERVCVCVSLCVCVFQRLNVTYKPAFASSH